MNVNYFEGRFHCELSIKAVWLAFLAPGRSDKATGIYDMTNHAEIAACSCFCFCSGPKAGKHIGKVIFVVDCPTHFGDQVARSAAAEDNYQVPRVHRLSATLSYRLGICFRPLQHHFPELFSSHACESRKIFPE